MRKIILFICLLITWFSVVSGQWSWDKSATQILDAMKDNNVQKTALDNSITSTQRWITPTLEWIKRWSTWYLQWLAYIWLWVALILIIYNGIMLLISGLTWSDEMWKFKKRFTSLVIWVVILTSWYLIIKFVVSIISQLF